MLRVKFKSFQYFLTSDVHDEASANFNQFNFSTVRARDVKGHRLQNGNFIFSWLNDRLRKMVLTTNQGDFITAGFVSDSEVPLDDEEMDEENLRQKGLTGR